MSEGVDLLGVFGEAGPCACSFVGRPTPMGSTSGRASTSSSSGSSSWCGPRSRICGVRAPVLSLEPEYRYRIGSKDAYPELAPHWNGTDDAVAPADAAWIRYDALVSFFGVMRLGGGGSLHARSRVARRPAFWYLAVDQPCSIGGVSVSSSLVRPWCSALVCHRRVHPHEF